jgi:hypothetical protein
VVVVAAEIAMVASMGLVDKVGQEHVKFAALDTAVMGKEMETGGGIVEVSEEQGEGDMDRKVVFGKAPIGDTVVASIANIVVDTSVGAPVIALVFVAIVVAAAVATPFFL